MPALRVRVAIASILSADRNSARGIFNLGKPKSRDHIQDLKQLRLAWFGVLPGYRNRGIVLLLIKQLVQEAVDKGYESCELSVIRDSNRKMKGLIEALGFRFSKRFRIYSREILHSDDRRTGTG